MAEIILNCTESDQDVCEYEIHYNNIAILVNFNHLIKKDTLFLNKVNIESDGPNIFGSGFKRVIKEIAEELCIEFGTQKIEISGTKRTSGRSKGKFPSTIKFDFTKLSKK